MMLLRVAICLILPLLAYSYCPHACSGHGSCGPNDRCTCYLKNDGVTPAWTGADCSLRTCPMNQAWSAKATKVDEAHPLVECSNKGNCNRNSGACECYQGYEGVACERTECINDCSGNGFCYTLSQIASLGSHTYTQAWDADQHVGCVCDSGYRGPDCSLRECPTGDDVMGGDGASKGRDCSGRGLCDYTIGLCSCFPGFFGSRCESQTILG